MTTLNPPVAAAMYEPRSNSKTAKVLAFFQANRDETLTADDIADKFGLVRNNVHTVLRPALDAQLLARDRDHFGDYVYSAGPQLATTAPAESEPSHAVIENHTAAASDEAWPPAPTPTLRRNAQVAVDPRDIAALPVDTGVPFHGPDRSPGAKWAPLFEKLTDNGHSVAYPLAWHTAVVAQAAKLNGALKKRNATYAYRARKISDTQARLWRIAK